MATVDDRVVSMAFENSKFESGVRTTLSSLDKLKAALKFGDASKGLAGISAAAKKTDLSPIARGIDGIQGKLGALRVAGVAVMSSMAIKAEQAGAAFIKQFTVTPVIDGLHEYEGQIQAIQTILANTQAAGTNLQDVNKALNQLNRYADKTIYNFGQMTKNIGTFTAAGVDLETAVGSIKGIANIAALSGSSADQAATAMYQLSQAISSGRVSLQDWNSVVNAGMGGTVFQRALAQTAVAMGEIDKSSLRLVGDMKNVQINGESFRNSIMAAPGKESWLTGKVLTNTLRQFSGELSKAELKAQGFSDAQVKAIQKQAKAAVNAATTVKTFTQLMDTTKEALGSGWAKTWQIIFGDFGEAKRLFTGLSNTISGFVGKSANARNSVLKDWKEMGGRTLLIDAIKRAFTALGDVLEPIKDAFRDIFPAKTGKDLLTFTQRFREFTKTLTPSPETVENLRRTFRGFFAVLDIGKQIIGGIFAGIGKMFDAIGDGSGGVLNLTGNIGDLIVRFRNWLKEGEKIKVFFEGLGSILAIPVRIIGTLAGALGSLFDTGDSGTGDSLAGMGKTLEETGKSASAAEIAISAFFDIIKKLGDVVQPILDRMGESFGNLPDAIGDAIANADYDTIFKILETTLIGGIFLAIKKALGGGLNIDFGGGVIKNLSGSLNTLNGSLKAIQTNIKANTLLQIGAAVLALAVAVTMLSAIDPDKLASAMTAVAVGLGQLMGAMAILTKISGGGLLQAAGFAGMATGLVILAGALNVLAIALVILSKLSWEELGKGLAGITGLLLVLSIATKPLSAAGPGMIIAGVGITALAVGLNILAGAVMIFGSMDLGQMAQGLLGMTAALVGIGLAVQLIPPSVLLIGPGLIAVGIALAAIGTAVKIFASMDVGQMAQGLIGVGTALGTIALAMSFMPPTLPLTAAGLILVGVALNGIAVAIGVLGGMDVSTLAKGIIAIGAALAVLAIGLTAMIATLPGAAALLVAAGALAILVPLIGILGTMSWGTILKGLGAMVLTLVALGIAGIAAAPGLIALGVALVVLGSGLALVSAAVYLLVSGLTKLAGEGAQGVGVVIAAFTAFVAILPKIIIEFIKGLVEIVAQIAEIAPAIVDSLVKIIKSLVDVIVKSTPQFARAAIELITGMLKVIRRVVPDFIRTGLVLFMALLKGIERNIGKITKTVANIVVKFLRALTSKLPQLISAGADALAALLKGIANNLAKVTRAAFDVVVKFIKAIANNLPRVVKAGIDIPLKLIKGIGNKFGQVVKTGAEIIIKFIKGVGNKASDLVKAGVNAAAKFVTALSRGLVKLADKGATAVINMIHGIADVIRKRGPELRAAFYDLGTAVMQGFIDGLDSLKDKVFDLIGDIADGVKGVANKALSVLSPSKEFYKIGQYVVLGLALGIEDTKPKAVLSSERMASDVITAFASKAIKLTKGQNAVLGELGNDLAKVFFAGALGIPQELDQVQQAFADMLDRMSTRLDESEARIKTLRQQRKQANNEADKLEHRKKQLLKGGEGKKQKRELGHLQNALDRQNNAVVRSNKALRKETELRNRLLAGKSTLVSGLEKEKGQLRTLVVEFNRISQALEDAKQALDDAKQAKADAAESIKSDFSSLPDLITEDLNGVPIDPLKAYTDALTKQIEATKKYKETLAKLKAAGLDDTTYQKLLDEGVGGQGFADSILAGGQTAIDSLKSLDSQLIDQATQLATSSAAKLYDAGIQAAQGLVDGLTSKQSELYGVMIGIATAMVKAIKAKLKIKSPSEEFARMGQFSMMGMARGLYKSSKKVTDAVAGVSEDALTAMKSKMKQISDAVTEGIDPNPTIRPILDLTDVQNGSKSLQSMMNVTPITAAASYGQATSISAQQAAAEELKEALAEQAAIGFTQNNYSPKALTDIEIYRRTKNLLSQARPVLTGPPGGAVGGSGDPNKPGG